MCLWNWTSLTEVSLDQTKTSLALDVVLGSKYTRVDGELGWDGVVESSEEGRRNQTSGTTQGSVVFRTSPTSLRPQGKSTPSVGRRPSPRSL